MHCSCCICQTSCFVFSTVKQECMSKHFGHHQGNTQILATSAEQPLYSLMQTVCAAGFSKQHLAGVHLTSVHLRSQSMQIALPLTFKQGGVQVVGAISCSCAHSEKRISGQMVCLKWQESTAIDSKLKIVVTARAGWFK